MGRRVTSGRPVMRMVWGMCGALLAVLASGSSLGAFEVQGLSAPHSMIVDWRTGDYFISNINGDPAARDDNGFITKLDGTGRVIALEFIDGSKGAPLHAPKGLAIVGDFLFVADIDHVKGYDTATGRLQFDLNLTPLGATSLQDLTRDAQGTLYVSDRESNFIAKIEPIHHYAVSILAKGPQLGQPNGLAVNPITQRLVMVSWVEGGIYEIGPTGTLTPLVARRFHHLGGVDFDEAGALYFSSLTDGVIYTVVDGKAIAWKEHLTTPADISINRRRRLLLVPSLSGNLVTTIPLN
jgi:hypothetical protein